MVKENTKDFAKGFCFKKIFAFFVLGSLVGSFYEEIVFFVQFREWTCRHDLLYGPFSTLYGFGLILFLIFLGNKNAERKFLKTFLCASLLGGIFEYLASLFLELFLGIKFWDYSTLFLNIHGRTTIPYMLAWGFMGSLILKVVYPFVSKWIEKIPQKIGNVIYIFLLFFFFINMFLSYTVFIRMIYRNKGVSPKTFIGRFYDNYYTNEYMYKKFPILIGK